MRNKDAGGKNSMIVRIIKMKMVDIEEEWRRTCKADTLSMYVTVGLDSHYGTLKLWRRTKLHNNNGRAERIACDVYD